MRFVKFFIFALVSLFLVFTALSLLFPSHLRVTRVINVSTDKAKTLRVISDIQTWDHWNRFVQNPELTNKKFEPAAPGRGYFSSDQMTIRLSDLDTTGVALLWDLKHGKQYPGGIDLFYINRDSLTVQWYFDLNFRWYPWEKLGAFVYDRKLGPVMEESLDSLRSYLEKSR